MMPPPSDPSFSPVKTTDEEYHRARPDFVEDADYLKPGPGWADVPDDEEPWEDHSGDEDLPPPPPAA